MVGVLGLLMVHRCWERLGGVKGNGNRGWEGGRIHVCREFKMFLFKNAPPTVGNT